MLLWYIFRGNSVLVGSLGEQLVSLASFALFLAGYETQSLDFSKESAFMDGLKSLFRQAGLEGKSIGVIIKVCMILALQNCIHSSPIQNTSE